MLGDRQLVDAVLDDYRAAPIEERDKALFAFIEKMNAQSNLVCNEDLERLRQLDWTDEAIYDAITVCALFNFYNRWIDATGVCALSDEAHREGGKRSAAGSYARR